MLGARLYACRSSVSFDTLTAITEEPTTRLARDAVSDELNSDTSWVLTSQAGFFALKGGPESQKLDGHKGARIALWSNTRGL